MVCGMTTQRSNGARQLAAAAAKLNQAHAAPITACQGMPPGYESPCGVIVEPHGPHDITAEQAVEPTSQDVSRRIDRLSLDERDHHFIAGWLTSSAPAAMDDALDALEIFRERRKQSTVETLQARGER